MLPLINRTEQSYGRSLMKPADIVAYAQENKIPVAAITDVHSLSNVPDFLQRCAKAGIHGIAGMTIQITKNNAAFGEMVFCGPKYPNKQAEQPIRGESDWPHFLKEFKDS